MLGPIFLKIWFQTAKVTFMVTRGHCFWCLCSNYLEVFIWPGQRVTWRAQASSRSVRQTSSRIQGQRPWLRDHGQSLRPCFLSVSKGRHKIIGGRPKGPRNSVCDWCRLINHMGPIISRYSFNVAVSVLYGLRYIITYLQG